MKKQNPIIDNKGNKRWYHDGKLHRLDGPAIECVDNPAIEWANADKYWYQHNKLHRLDGPAIEYANGDKCWYLDDVKYSEADYWLRIILLQAKLKFHKMRKL